MNLLKTSVYTSLSTAVTFICGFIVAKVVAVKIGPTGVALVGQYQNTVAVLTLLGSGAIGMGVVKLLAEHTGNKEFQLQIIGTAVKVVLLSSLLVGVGVGISAPWISQSIFKTGEYASVFWVFAIAVFFLAFNMVTQSVLNGMKEIRLMTFSNITFSIVGIGITITAAQFYGVHGVLMAASISAIIVAAVNVFILRKANLLKAVQWFKWPNKTVLYSLSTFILMTLFSSIMSPVAQFFVRTYIIGSLSISDAGYWQGMIRISDYYLTFITTVLGVYYLPRLSEIKDRVELRREVLRGYLFILPPVGIMALLIAVLRHWVILILYSPDFLPMEKLFPFQMLGDFIKIAAWLLAFLMWAKGEVKLFVITELLSTASYIIITTWMIQRYGLIGTSYAFCLNYFLYLITMIVVIRKRLL